MNVKEKGLLDSLAAEIRAGNFSDELTIVIAGDQVVRAFERIEVHRAYVSNWEALWAQATVADLDALINANFLQPHPQGNGRYWLDTRRILADST